MSVDPEFDDAPDLSYLEWNEYADLLGEVDKLSEHITEETGH